MGPSTAQKMKFSIRDFFSKCDHTAPQFPARQFPVDLVTFTEEMFNGKLKIYCLFLLIEPSEMHTLDSEIDVPTPPPPTLAINFPKIFHLRHSYSNLA